MCGEQHELRSDGCGGPSTVDCVQHTPRSRGELQRLLKIIALCVLIVVECLHAVTVEYVQSTSSGVTVGHVRRLLLCFWRQLLTSTNTLRTVEVSYNDCDCLHCVYVDRGCLCLAVTVEYVQSTSSGVT